MPCWLHSYRLVYWITFVWMLTTYNVLVFICHFCDLRASSPSSTQTCSSSVFVKNSLNSVVYPYATKWGMRFALILSDSNSCTRPINFDMYHRWDIVSRLLLREIIHLVRLATTSHQPKQQISFPIIIVVGLMNSVGVCHATWTTASS